MVQMQTILKYLKEMITNHTQLINWLIQKNNLKSYLEIGINNPWNNFHQIKCERKQGVDPNYVNAKKGEPIINITSDEYFTNWQPVHNDKFDIVFVDGDHTADQVKKDFENSLKCLNENGFIVLHDTLPDKEEYTKVPRETKIWYGDVYKFVMTLSDYKEISFVTINIDCGCTVVWKSDALNDYGKNLHVNYDWDLYKTLGRYLLKVIQPSEIETYFS